MLSIELCASEDLLLLRQLAIKTFVDTYGIHNTPEVMANYLEEAFSEDQLLVEIINPDSEFYVLKEGAQWAGYIKLNEAEAQTEERTDDVIELERIYVDRLYQGRGYGHGLRYGDPGTTI